MGDAHDRTPQHGDYHKSKVMPTVQSQRNVVRTCLPHCRSTTKRNRHSQGKFQIHHSHFHLIRICHFAHITCCTYQLFRDMTRGILPLRFETLPKITNRIRPLKEKKKTEFLIERESSLTIKRNQVLEQKRFDELGISRFNHR